MRNLLVTAVLLAIGIAGPAVAETLTLDQAVSIALENNPAVLSAQLEAQKGEARVTVARTKRLPSLTFETYGSESLNRLSLEFEEGAFGTFPETGPIPDKDTRIDVARSFNLISVASITQPITQLHKINLGIRMNEADLAATRETMRSTRQQIAREVKAAYFLVLQAESSVKAANDAVEAHQEVVREMNVRVSQKSVLEADALDAKSKLVSMEVSLLKAKNGYASAQQQLNYLLGRDINTPFELSGAPAPSPARLDASFVNRPDIKEAELRLQQARLDSKLTAADRIPEVSLVVSHTTPINVDGLPSNISAASVVISYEPFTWGRRGAELSEKRHAVHQAELSLRNKQNAAALEIATSYRKVTEAEAELRVRELEADAARERLRVTRTRFNQQAARQDEMFSASATLTNAAAREQEAIANYGIARADYDKAIGEE